MACKPNIKIAARRASAATRKSPKRVSAAPSAEEQVATELVPDSDQTKDRRPAPWARLIDRECRDEFELRVLADRLIEQVCGSLDRFREPINGLGDLLEKRQAVAKRTLEKLVEFCQLEAETSLTSMRLDGTPVTADPFDDCRLDYAADQFCRRWARAGEWEPKPEKERSGPADDKQRKYVCINERSLPQAAMEIAQQVESHRRLAIKALGQAERTPETERGVLQELLNVWREQLEEWIQDVWGSEVAAYRDKFRMLAIKFRGEVEKLTPEPQGESVAAIEMITLDDADYAILAVLYNQSGSRLTKEQISHEMPRESSRSERTIGSKLKRLREAGLTCRPKGKKGGESITQKGSKRFEARRKSEAV